MEKMVKFWQKGDSLAIRTIEYKGGSYDISYEMVGQGEPTLLFLHGWGSNKELMRRAFPPAKGWCSLYLDMPGFGKSPNEAVLTTQDYANIVKLFLQSLDKRPQIVVGHSFGGKVATLLEPKLLVLLSSAGIPVAKPWSVRAKIWLYKVLKPFGGAKLKSLFVSKDARGMSEAMYETFKRVVDEDFSERFASFDKDALLFWGREDRATPLECGQKIASLIPKSELIVMDGDHFFFLDKGEQIMEKVRERYEKL